MLNRTNRTLSANLNRLNLGIGTRSLAPVARFNTSASTLHTRLVHPVVMRAGVMEVPVYPIPIGRTGIPTIPGSPAVSPWLIASCAIHPRVDSDADRRSPGQRQASWLGQGQPCQRGAERGADATQRLARRGQAVRKPFTGKRRPLPGRLAGMSWRAILSPAAAPGAAAGG
jgi:hypothetical protein